MKVVSLPNRAPLAAALLAGLLVWLTAPGRPTLLAEPRLPWAQATKTRLVGTIRGGDTRNPIPREPMAVAVLSGGDLLVADAGLGEVFRFTSDGKLRGSYDGRSELEYPVGLAVADDDRVWVADLWRERVYRLDLANGSLHEVSPETAGYRRPAGLAYRDGLLYVADVGRHQVLVLEPDGKLVRAIGAGPGREPGQLSYPNAVWASPAGEVVVADSNNGRVQVFDRQGRLLRAFQPPGMLQPRGIVGDPPQAGGRLLVADALNHHIAVLDPAGNVLARVGEQDGLDLPGGLALRGQRLYVADRGNGRIVVWEIGDE